MFCSAIAPLLLPSPPLAFASAPMDVVVAGNAAADETVSFLFGTGSDIFAVEDVTSAVGCACADTKDVMQ